MAVTEPPTVPSGPWERARQALVEKMIAELSFEHLLRPEPTGGGSYRAGADHVTYAFSARRAALESWRVVPGSVRRIDRAGGEGEAARDPFRLVLDMHRAWGLDPAVTALLVHELNATVAADAHLLATGLPVAKLADLPHSELEGYQTGHPWIFANKGRVGFSANDRQAYAPESRQRRRLPWMAAHRDLATHYAMPGLEQPSLIVRELDEQTRDRFATTLRHRRLDIDDYVWLPVHPWQWDEVVGTLFASEVGADALVPLGEADDAYLPQQSIRTFTNLDHPRRLDVKLPLSILNTMVYRGLPPELVEAAPHCTAWIHAIRDRDPFLRDECRLILPGEVAAVTVRHPVLDEVPGVPYRFRQLLGALWREPLRSHLRPGERARTLASLLHVDGDGRPFVGELVRRSGLSAPEWLARLFGAVLPPLLHVLYRYGLGFNPHGENATVVYDSGDVPVRLAVKDFVDDMKLLHEDLPEYAGLPVQSRAVLLRCDEEELCGSLFKSLFVCHFRYLAPLCHEHLGVGEDEFWALAGDEVLRYQKRFPELADRFSRFDVLAPDFARVCLNRERLLPGGYHDRAARDAHFHLDAPRVPNPLARPR